jgi:5-oxoprolinase (ATP-hydrolysing)
MPPTVFGPTEDMPLDYNVVQEAFESLTARINEETGMSFTAHEVACGFINVGEWHA